MFPRIKKGRKTWKTSPNALQIPFSSLQGKFYSLESFLPFEIQTRLTSPSIWADLWKPENREDGLRPQNVPFLMAMWTFPL